jgi:MerR family transcriptional regulator/heat shock protein HspR
MTVEKKQCDLIDTCRDLGVLPDDLEAIIEEGLISVLIDGNRKMISDDEVDRLRMILRLQNDLSVNLPGVDVILEMRRKMIQMRLEVDSILEFIREQVSKDLREILGEENYPMALGPGDEFLAVGRGVSSKRRGGGSATGRKPRNHREKE